ncbi:MAG: hypothetical protein Q9190_004432, partial [Brigantiaea leucoxantha]
MAEILINSLTIERSPATKVPLEVRPHIFRSSLVITWSLWSLCILLEVKTAALIQDVTPGFVWRMWVALLATFALSFQEAVLAFNLILASFASLETEPRPTYRLKGGQAPRVDVLITCCGEPVEVVLNTAAAAASQDYPRECLHVFVLDDGHSEELQKSINALSARWREERHAKVTYLSRKVKDGVRSYFKAGNLVFGISESESLSNSEFVAGLDADMVPEPDWLRQMVPHLVLDDRLALICAPQSYYNVPAGDPLGQKADFDMYFGVQEVLNDHLGACMCTGSGYVVRRSALNVIGGWPLAESGEDYMCSALLGDAGWGIAFERQKLQLGLAPSSLRALLKQRMRWTDAGIEVHQRFGYYLPGSKLTSQMTWSQRAVNMLYVLRDYAPITNMLAMVLLPIAIAPITQSGQSLNIPPEFRSHCDLLWKLFLISLIAQKLNTWILYHHIGISPVLNFQSNEIWAAP